jgi:3-oxoacyl-[acyl-carrier protein] reductase
METLMNIKGKSIVITGASRGLGRSMAVMLAGKGARLALVDLDKAGLDETIRFCGGSIDHATYVANVAHEHDVERLFEQIAQEFAGIDAVVNNAGTNADALLIKPQGGIIEKMSLDEFNKVVEVDLVGVFLCGREAAVQMLASGHEGVIINISSISQAGNIGQSNYSAAKAGVSAMTVAWAQELARWGIRVAAIAPGFSETQMVIGMKQDMQEKFKQRIPLRRFARPEEIAHAVVFAL